MGNDRLVHRSTHWYLFGWIYYFARDIPAVLLSFPRRIEMAARAIYVSLRRMFYDFYGLDSQSRISGRSFAILHLSSLAFTVSIKE